MKLLLVKGANPNIISNNGNTALKLNSQASGQKNYKGILKLLKKFGAKK